MRCERCGGEAIPILYGSPAYEAVEAFHRGELVLGGCLAEEGLPTWSCSACEHKWGSLTFEPVLGTPWDDLDDED